MHNEQWFIFPLLANSDPDQISIALWALLTVVQGGIINRLVESWRVTKGQLNQQKISYNELQGTPSLIYKLIINWPTDLTRVLLGIFLCAAIIVMTILTMLILHYEIKSIPDLSKWKHPVLVTGVILIPLTTILYVVNKTCMISYFLLYLLKNRDQLRFQPGWLNAYWSLSTMSSE